MFDPVFDAVHARAHRDILKLWLFHTSPGALPSIASKCLPPPSPTFVSCGRVFQVWSARGTVDITVRAGDPELAEAAVAFAKTAVAP